MGKPKGQLLFGRCEEVLSKFPDGFATAVITDPPYGLSANPDMYEVMRAWGRGEPYLGDSAGFMGRCYHPDTDVLTNSGWRPVSEVGVGDEVCSLNPDTREIEYVKCEKIFEYDFDGCLSHIHGRSVEQMVTPNHNVLIEHLKSKRLELRRADNLPSQFRMVNQGIWKGHKAIEIEIEGNLYPAKPFFLLLGLFLGDGHSVSRKAHAWKQDFFGFSVFKKREKEWARKALRETEVKFTETPGDGDRLTFYVYDKPLLSYFKKLGKAKNKHIPNELFGWGREFLECLYTGMINSDGCIQGYNDQNVYYTTSERLADDFQRLCLHTGRSCVKTKSNNSAGSFKPNGYGWVLSVVQTNKVFWLEKINHKNPSCRNYDEVEYSGPVHCVQLAKHHILLSRFNGRTVWSGNSWDSFVPGPDIWNEVMRTLQPGGHILSFSGTRTYDLMVAGMDMAAENHDCRLSGYHSWTYGCLSDDSEILTENGWKLGIEIQEGESVMMWDSETESLEFGNVMEKFLAPFSGDMIAFKNDNTDQLLTPNHRVYKQSRIRKVIDGQRQSWFEKEWCVEEAGKINRWNPVFVPLSGWHEGDGVGGEDYARILGWVWTEGGFDESGSGVRIYQSSVNQAHVDEIQRLMDEYVPYHKHYTRERTYKGRKYIENTWFFTGEMAEKIRKDLPSKHPDWDLLWRMSQDEKLAFMQAALDGDGSSKGENKSWAFYQKDLADLEWFQTLLHMVGMQGRINEKKYCVALHDNPVTQFQGRHLNKFNKIPYDGNVWCVRVQTGAFVARRNGCIFITGNSGFPKSMDISKAIDKSLGEERTEGGRAWSGGQRSSGIMGDNQGTQERVIFDVPATEASKLWEGYGTALKPAHEPVAEYVKGGGDPLVTKSIFHYIPKPSKKERNKGCKNLFWLMDGDNTERISKEKYEELKDSSDHRVAKGNVWPTVKPIELMRRLIRMTKKPGRKNVILEPFMGSGTTIIAAILEGCDYVGIDADPVAFDISKSRVHYFKCLGELGLK